MDAPLSQLLRAVEACITGLPVKLHSHDGAKRLSDKAVSFNSFWLNLLKEQNRP